MIVLVDLAEIQAAYYMVAATGVLIAAVFYVLNMRATLQTRQAQLFMPIYATFHEKEYQRGYYEVMNWQWSDFEDYQKKYSYQNNSEAAMYRSILGAHLEGIGVLLRRRLIDPSFVDDLMSQVIVRYWEKFGPLIRESRVKLNYPFMGEQSEYLYNQIKPIMEKQLRELTTV